MNFACSVFLACCKSHNSDLTEIELINGKKNKLEEDFEYQEENLQLLEFIKKSKQTNCFANKPRNISIKKKEVKRNLSFESIQDALIVENKSLGSVKETNTITGTDDIKDSPGKFHRKKDREMSSRENLNEAEFIFPSHERSTKKKLSNFSQTASKERIDSSKEIATDKKNKKSNEKKEIPTNNIFGVNEINNVVPEEENNKIDEEPLSPHFG